MTGTRQAALRARFARLRAGALFLLSALVRSAAVALPVTFCHRASIKSTTFARPSFSAGSSMVLPAALRLTSLRSSSSYSSLNCAASKRPAFRSRMWLPARSSPWGRGLGMLLGRSRSRRGLRSRSAACCRACPCPRARRPGCARGWRTRCAPAPRPLSFMAWRMTANASSPLFPSGAIQRGWRKFGNPRRSFGRRGAAGGPDAAGQGVHGCLAARIWTCARRPSALIS